MAGFYSSDACKGIRPERTAKIDDPGKFSARAVLIRPGFMRFISLPDSVKNNYRPKKGLKLDSSILP